MYAFSAFQENRAVGKRQSNEALLRKYFGLGSFSKVHRDFFLPNWDICLQNYWIPVFGP